MAFAASIGPLVEELVSSLLHPAAQVRVSYPCSPWYLVANKLLSRTKAQHSKVVATVLCSL